MSMRFKIAGLAVAVVAAAAYLTMSQPGTAKETPATKGSVAAIVNGDKIMKSEVLEAMKALPVQGQDEKLFPMVVNQIVNEKLLDAQVSKANVKQTAEYKERLAELQKQVDNMKSQLERDVFLASVVNKDVNDAAVKAEYESFKKANAGKQEAHARHILLSTEAEAKKVIEDLGKGKDFVELAKKRSTGPSAQNGGDLGYFTEEDMVPEFSKAAFNLKAGEYTKAPIKSQFGWHVIKLEDKRKRAVPQFEQVEAAIRNKLGQGAVMKLVEELRAKADVKLFDMNGKPVEAPAAN
ncbi:MAG: peptidylprolyl isomerase [Alphaproteobacteria bacterium]|nr:peptidylprolyl isomerase [Alphaproteobacteria bacterium]